MGISSAGVGSGLDVNSMITGLMGVEKKPLAAVAQQKSDYQSKISAYGTIKSDLSSFQSSIAALTDVTKFNVQTATSADTTVFTVTSNGSATNAEHAITVNQVAKSQKLASQGFSNITDTLDTGTLNIAFGSYAATDSHFTANTAKSSLAITIDNTNNTLAGVRDAINAAKASVSATIINNGTSYQLVLTSSDTGEVNSLQISGVNQLAYDKSMASGDVDGLSEVQAAKNALLNVDGISIVKASNTITDVIEGLTLNVLSASNANNIKLNIASNQDAVKTSVTSFVDAYNKLDKSFRNLTKFDSVGKNSGALLGDATARSVINQIKSVMTKSIATSGNLTTLSNIGVSFQRDGQLALDASKLTSAVDSHYSDIATLFASSAKISDTQISYVGSTSKTQAGIYAITVNQLGTSAANTAGTINGVTATGSLTGLKGAVGDASEGLNLKVSGGALGPRGTVEFSLGYAAQLDRIINNLLSDTGILTSKTEGMNKSISQLDKKTESINLRLVGVEARYRAQFTKLDSLLSGMTTTSSFLTQQINSMNANKNA